MATSFQEHKQIKYFFSKIWIVIMKSYLNSEILKNRPDIFRMTLVKLNFKSKFYIFFI